MPLAGPDGLQRRGGSEQVLTPVGGVHSVITHNGYWATQTGYHSESTGRRCGRLSKSKLEPAVGNRLVSIAKLNMLNGAAKAQSAIR